MVTKPKEAEEVEEVEEDEEEETEPEKKEPVVKSKRRSDGRGVGHSRDGTETDTRNQPTMVDCDICDLSVREDKLGSHKWKAHQQDRRQSQTAPSPPRKDEKGKGKAKGAKEGGQGSDAGKEEGDKEGEEKPKKGWGAFWQ